MADSIDVKTRETLRGYLRDLRSLPNEEAKRQRFAVLIGELFPGTSAISDYVRGVEKVIQITRPQGDKRGRADAYYGQAIIEFERDLSATLSTAEEQLREYVAGVWQRKGQTKIIAIASDGLNWRIYRPVLRADSEPALDTVSLDLLQAFRLAEDKLSSFWLWLTSFLFRPQQVKATAERFQIEFGSLSPFYRDGMATLKRAWARVGADPEARLAFETWQRYLTVTYGRLTESASAEVDDETGESISELEEFFLRHTYLASIARLLVWASLSHGKSTEPLRSVAQEVLSGRFFESKRLANLVDDDFFHWIRRPKAEGLLTGTWEQILSRLAEYDLSSVQEDVLKGVYQELIDPKDRHDLGEYYTPDWLCERMVAELLPQHGYKAVLDPSCGSGSFLRAVIGHFLAFNPEGTDNERLRLILANVQGIDIHPVAVTIARATYVLALSNLVKSARKPVQIPVYLADSLFLPREVEANLLDQLSGVEITFGARKDQRQVVIPEMLIHSPELFDEAIAACTKVAEEHARSQLETRGTLANYLNRAVRDLSKLLAYETALDALWKFTDELATLIRRKGDTIWSFIIRNSYRPAMIRGQFDFIIGNPPWLSYRYISDPEYQDEIKRRAVDRYKIAPRSQKLFTQMELATVFLAHSMATFGRARARMGFVMPRSVLTAEQHQNLIQRKYSSETRLRLTGYWDLWDVAPLFNVPCCVLFARRDPTPGGSHEVLPVLEWHGTLPGRDVPWRIAESKLSCEKREGHVVFLGSRAAFSTLPGAKQPTKGSRYASSFKDGATIYPRNFYFVKVDDLHGSLDPEGTYWAATDEETAAISKPAYQDIRLSGFIEGQFIYSVAISKHVLPFVVMTPSIVVLPVNTRNGSLDVLDASSLKKEGYRYMGAWMEHAEMEWASRRGEKLARQSLLERLNYGKGLTSQVLHQRHLVLYNAGGTNLAAAYFDRNSQPLPLFIEHKLYWAAFADPEEADYIVAILNCETVNSAIKPFQTTGLLGERDIEKKVLDLPIPTYDSTQTLHKKIALLGAEARLTAGGVIHDRDFTAQSTLARRRAYVRTSIRSGLDHIDKLVKELW